MSDPVSWLESVEGREAIERGAGVLWSWTAGADMELELALGTWKNADPTDAAAAREAVTAVLSALLSGVSCDTCGGSGFDQEAARHPYPDMLPCPDCKGSGRRPSVLVPREETP